jgi:hypothetical protein
MSYGPDAASNPLSQAPVRPDLEIDWAIPSQRTGWRGAVARFFGPGQNRAAVVVQVVGLAVCAGLLAWYLAISVPNMSPALAWWQIALVALIGFDLIGGVLTNATGAAKRWYHRPGSRRSRLVFIAAHVVYLCVIALVVLPLDWTWLGLNTALLLVAAAVIEWVPLSVQRPVAAGWVVAAIFLNMILAPTPPALMWFVPLFFLKLLVYYQTLEAPFVGAGRRGES